ncbi:MAG: 5-(carboxyamino)imidazole ribonucleotide synthase [Verrucomicrobiales bacterium]|nr:5-(carboxyamino)imidazole ribonucleotide synthase [Verrucomicrobiales bacterium]
MTSHILQPGQTLGIIGGGQLGRMLAREARRSGYRVVVFTDEYPPSPAGQFADREINAPYFDPEATAQFIREVDVVTMEFENIPGAFLEAVEQRRPIFPSRHALETTQNREKEKNFLKAHGLAHAAFRVVHGPDTLRGALTEIGVPCVLKTAAFGYDGKGQIRLDGGENVEEIWHNFGAPRGVVEQWVDFAMEISVVGARDQRGAYAAFPPCENIHRHHILDTTIAPARLAPERAAEAIHLARSVADALDYVGTLAVEMFVTQDGQLLVNEIAPRPHNSGHHTIDACDCSQFEQQLRAVAGLDLGSTRQHAPAVMKNLLGDVWFGETTPPDWSPVLRHPRAKLHLYGKRRALTKRKMGHFTVLGDTVEEALRDAGEIKNALDAAAKAWRENAPPEPVKA